MKKLTTKTREILEKSQKNEISEYHIYKYLAGIVKTGNRKVLTKISNDELDHYEFWKKFTGKDIAPDWLKIRFYTLMARVFGLTFGVKLMENGEESAQVTYVCIAKEIPQAKKILHEEEEHEKQILKFIDEEVLIYVSSIVLGLNDALVELTGVLAGLTLTLVNSRLIAFVGLVTGVAAALSMAASAYLSIRSEKGSTQNPNRSALYTGVAYILTVIFLVLPFFIFQHIYLALAICLLTALLIILIFNLYVSVIHDVSFKRRFAEMAIISLGVSLITFLFGFFIRRFFNVVI